MKNICLSILTLLFLSCNGFSQHFKVLFCNNCTMKNGTNWEIVEKGNELNKWNQIKVGTNGYIALLHITGKTTELKLPGNYNISDLAESLESRSSTFSLKYSEFTIKKIPENTAWNTETERDVCNYALVEAMGLDMDSTSSIENFIMGNIYEKIGDTTYALYHYKKSYELGLNVREYQFVYYNFLSRYKIIE